MNNLNLKEKNINPMDKQKTFKQDALEGQYQLFREFAADDLRQMRAYSEDQHLHHYFEGKYHAYKLAADSMKNYAEMCNDFKLSKKQLTQ